ncbi:MAG: ferric reductase-like transmembrane domain-containing protein [Actinomycetota bacterium]|nr:ferric reductase-like transmembrane domain-containing protein [Actinomycetota bacterium]
MTFSAAASSGPSPLWYLSRGSGIVALILLTASVVLGILEGVRWSPRRWPRFTVPLLHRDVSLLAVVFIAAHIATVVLDGYAPIGWRDAVLPFLSQYRPLWLGLGTLAFDLLVAVLVTSLLRRRLSYASWRAVHWLAYASWAIALVHGLGTGSDTKVAWMLALEGLCLAFVIAAALWRLRSSFTHLPRVRVGGRVVAGLAPIALIVWVVHGPLGPGWARQAGTPVSLLGNAAAFRQGGAGLTGPFQAALSGTLVQSSSQVAGSTLVEIDTTLGGGVTGSLRITLRGTRSPDGGLTIQSSAVKLAPASGNTTYEGPVTAVAGNTLTATVTAPDGSAFRLSIQVTLTGSGGAVRGTLRGSPTTGRGD